MSLSDPEISRELSKEAKQLSKSIETDKKVKSCPISKETNHLVKIYKNQK